MEKKEFVITAFGFENEIFVIYVAFISQNSDIYPFYKVYIISLKADNLLISISFKNINSINVFFKNLAIKFSKHNTINNHSFNLLIVNNYFINIFST